MTLLSPAQKQNHYLIFSDLYFDVKLDVNFSNESEKDLKFGLYVIENLDGAVKDPVTGELITPGSAGYEEAALDETNILVIFPPSMKMEQRLKMLPIL